jgi:hypothetical protein
MDRARIQQLSEDLDYLSRRTIARGDDATEVALAWFRVGSVVGDLLVEAGEAPAARPRRRK